MTEIKKFAQDWSNSGGNGMGIMGPSEGGLGFGTPGGGGQGLGNRINLPPSSQGHSGNLAPGPWSGDNITDETLKTGFFNQSVGDFTAEELINKIRTLMKIDTRESRDLVVFLKKILDDKFQRLKAARRIYDASNIIKKSTLIAHLKQDPFTLSLFAEHNMSISELDNAEVPDEVTHFALHNLVHKLAQTQTPESLVGINSELKEMWEGINTLKKDFREGKVAIETVEEYLKRIQSIAWATKITPQERNILTMTTSVLNKMFHALHNEVPQMLKDIEQTPMDNWPELIEQFKTKYGKDKVDYFFDHSSEWDNVLRTKLWPKFGIKSGATFPAKVSKQDFYDFYTAMMALKYSADTPSSIQNILADAIIRFASAVLEGARRGIHFHIEYPLMGAPNTWAKIKAAFGSIEETLSKLNADSLSAEDLSTLARIAHPESPDMIDTWVPISVEAAKLEKLLEQGVDMQAIGQQADHLIDYAHHRGRVGDQWLPMKDEANPTKFMTEKSEGWDEEFLEKHSPKIYNIFKRLQRLSNLRGFVKESQGTAQPFKGKCPESGKTVYVSHSDYVKNDFKADCPEGDRKLEKIKSVSIEDYKKHKKKKKKRKGYLTNSKIVRGAKPSRRFSPDNLLKDIENDLYESTKLYWLKGSWSLEQIRDSSEKLVDEVLHFPQGYIDHWERGEEFDREYEEYVDNLEKTHKTRLIQSLQEYIDNLIKEQEYKPYVTEDWIQQIQQSSPDKWDLLLKKWLNKYGQEVVQEWTESTKDVALFDIPLDTDKVRSSLKVEFLTTKDFQNFYGLSLLLGHIHSDLCAAWQRNAGQKIVGIAEKFTRKILKAAKTSCIKESSHLIYVAKLENKINAIEYLQNRFGSVSHYVKQAEMGSIDFANLADMFNQKYWEDNFMFGGEAWGTIAQEAKKTEEMLPVTLCNLKAVVVQVDHVVDLAHNSGLFLSDYVNLEDSSYESVEDLLDDKTENWNEEYFAKHTPEVYKIHENLKNPIYQFASPAKKVNHKEVHSPEIKRTQKEAQLKPSITFTPKEQQIIDAVKETSEELNIKCYLVGGSVRDKLLGKEESDLDFMCEDRAEDLVAKLNEKYNTGEPIQYDRSKALMVSLGGEALDFINAERLFVPLKQNDSLEGDEEFSVSFDDAYRRDLTINTLMYNLSTNEIIDPTGRGLDDLRDGIINTVIDPLLKFKIHGVDMLRALRFAVVLGFDLGSNMLEAMKVNANRVLPRDKGGDISNRRVRRELRKTIDTPQHWAKMRELLSQVGLDIILADDVQDVQDDFEGGIDFHFGEENQKVACMRIKKFTKEAGILDFFKGQKEDKSLKDDEARYVYLAQKLDEILVKTPVEQKKKVTEQFFNNYPQLSYDGRKQILDKIRFYKASPERLSKKVNEDTKWVD